MTGKFSKQGFTLIEMLLVMVIISIIIFASVGYMQQRALQLRIDRTSTQMQQILNAGLSYYVANGKWPAQLSELQPAYIPSTLPSPWQGKPYFIVNDGKQLYVSVPITFQSGKGSALAAANVIAGSLPLSYTSTTDGTLPDTPPSKSSPCTATSTTCYVVASVNIPGYNLNNASAVNFAGLYHHGGCVPVPECPMNIGGTSPNTTMTPQILVTPAQVSGTNDNSAPANVYPISSFTAYAVGGDDTTPPNCQNSTIGGGSCVDAAHPTVKAYWRVCIQVVTEKGKMDPATNTTWGKNQILQAITRCTIKDEPAGSDFTVFSN